MKWILRFNIGYSCYDCCDSSSYHYYGLILGILVMIVVIVLLIIIKGRRLEDQMENRTDNEMETLGPDPTH